MAVDQALVDAAVSLVEARFPGEVGAGAAAMRLDDGSVLTSTAPRVVNPAVETCHETGAVCEAWKLNQRITESVCVTRSDTGEYWILAPCGVCQERLFAHGPGVEVAVSSPKDPQRWQSLRLDQVAPHWWGQLFANND